MASLTTSELKQIIGAMLFGSVEPVNMAALMTALREYYEDPKEFRPIVENAVKELQMDCAGSGLELVRVASGYRYQVRRDYAHWVQKLKQRRVPRYSRATMETLAMVAYEQPVTRGEIEDIRGVKTSGEILRSLRDRGWVRELGHKQVPGLPILYGTTRLFLDYFNLRSLDDLPPREEIESLLSTEGAPARGDRSEAV